MNGTGKNTWDKAQDLFRRIRELESRGDRADPELVEARAELRRILGLPIPRVERRSWARLERRKAGPGTRRGRGRGGPDRRASAMDEVAGARRGRRRIHYQIEPRTALLDRIHKARAIRRMPPVARRRDKTLADKVLDSAESSGVAKLFWRRI